MAHPKIVETEDQLEVIVRSAKSVAVIGMKGEAEPDVPAFEIPRVVQARGLRVIPVNPKLETALGEKAHPSLAAIGGGFDTVNVFRKSEAVPQIADEVLALSEAHRPKVVWLQTGIRNDAAAEKLAAAGITVVQDRCLGVYASRYLKKPFV
ncbi:MAG: CoA-binding protein [Myxococcaceae bacterium]|nr:CoA-binding protein [Myxococcaceae bacterium]